MIFQAGDMLKNDNRYDRENNAVVIVMKVYELAKEAESGTVRSYDLLFLSRSWQGEGEENEDLVKGYRQWQIEDGSWRKIS